MKNKSISLVGIVCSVILGLKLSGIVSWSWWWVIFSPLLVQIFIVLVCATIIGLIEIILGDD